jgi:serine/threonine protein kinase
MPIAAGGMAMVWAARLKGTRGFQKIFAVKTMLPNLVEDDQFEKMFLDEASLASKIRHPNAVEIIDLGEQRGVLFLAMEWIDGVPLNQVMKVAKRQGGVPLTVAARIVMQACAGLHAAHELTDAKGKLIGLVHRDISPQNILVTFAGVAKVVDFGVAKATALGESTTRAGQVKGKIGYMAPEQGRGEALDRRADVFAMGIVLYALTTGQHPFRRDSDAATLFAITSNEAATPPRKIVPTYPATLERVVMKALEKDREKRFASARELFHALDKALPLHTRGSDEEVGVFITELFSEQRRTSQAALAEALERADRHELTDLKSSPYSESTRSGVNPVPSGGATARIVPADLGVAHEAAAPPPDSRATVSARRALISGGLLLVGGLAAGSIWLGRRQAAQPTATLKPSLPKLTASPPVLSPAASAPVIGSAPDAPPAVVEPAAPNAAPPATTIPLAPTSVKPRPVQASSPPKKAWKQDPGF